jgi:predicted DNA-binding transcriptional regulator YafY
MRIMDTKQLIDKAISERKVISFVYEEQPRTVEPYMYGMLGNVTQLHAYQFAGGSNSGGIPEWRNFHIDKIESLKIYDQTFELQLTYHPENANYTKIIKKIKL